MDSSFKDSTLKRFNHTCSFTKDIVPKWTSKKESKGLTIPDGCDETKDLMLYSKDGDKKNKSDDNVQVFCKRHYYIVFHELRYLVKRLAEQSAGISKQRVIRATLTNKEFAKLLRVSQDENQQMLLATLYYLGSRITETLLLEKTDIHVENGKPFMNFRAETTKRYTERNVPIPKVFYERLVKFASVKKDKLFKYTKQDAWRIVQACIRRAGIKKRIHPHSFRHTYASNVYDKTGDLKIVQELLGHKNINTTSMYAHVSMAKKKSTVDNVFSE